MFNRRLVPELYCRDIEVTKAFYTQVFGFEIKYQRPEEQFIYFTCDGVDIMVEGISGSGRRWLTGQMDPPFGRGVNFQWDVVDIEGLYARIEAVAPESIYLAMETKQYCCASTVITQQQFIAQDPDGYLFRFCCDIGRSETA